MGDNRYRPVDVVLATRGIITAAPMTHDRLGRPLIGPCRVWTGYISEVDGYGRMTNRRDFGTAAPQLVHRVGYAMGTGVPLLGLKEIPLLDHLCRVRACFAYRHLEPCSYLENSLRGDPNQNFGKTRCDKGHPFDEANTIQRADGSRRCRECKKIDNREAYRAKHAPDLLGKPPLSPSEARRPRPAAVQVVIDRLAST